MSCQHSIHHGRGSNANSIHFYQEVQAQELQNEELKIRRSFVERYWKGVVSNPISLTLPNGSLWKMFWVKRGEDIWLQKNWKKFARSLRCGDVLFFKYKGGSEFHVKIFDDTSLEIGYSCMRDNGDKKEDISDDECIEIKNDGQKTPTQVKGEKIVNSNEEVIRSFSSPHFETKSKRKITFDSDATHQNVSGANTCSSGDTAKKFRSEPVKERAGKTLPKENPSFVLILSQSYIHEYKMRIPSKFSKEHLKELDGTATIKRVGDKEERSWEVKVRFDAANGHSIFSTGWKSFAQDNKLKAGDLFKFEITQQNPFSFRITLTRVRSEPTLEIDKHKPDRFPVEIMEFVGNFPSGKFEEGSEGISRSCPKSKDSESAGVKLNTFIVCVESLDKLIVPIQFLKRHKIRNGNMVQLKIGEKLWSVELNSGQFSKGWAEFVNGCKMKMGDTCLFEMIDEENLVFKVSVVLNV